MESLTRDENKLYSLTLSQQDIFFEHFLFPQIPVYNIGAKIKIVGTLDAEAMNKAYRHLINQHDAFRITIINNDQQEPCIKIFPESDFILKFIDFSKEKEPGKVADEFMRGEFIKPISLTEMKLLHKFTLVKVEKDFHYLFSVYHHIITDGWGTSLMFQRLVKNYNEIIEHGEIISTYPYKYTDFIDEDKLYNKSPEYVTDKEYWVKKFKVIPEKLIPRRNNEVFLKSRREELYIKRELYNKLISFSTENNATTFHTLLAAAFVYFGRYFSNSRFAIGLPVLNRSKSTHKKTVGLFMGISPLLIQMKWDGTVIELINEIKAQLRQDYRHQRFPLGKLIQELNIFQKKDDLFNIIFSYEKQNYSDSFYGTDTVVMPLTHESERAALAIYVREFTETDDVRIDFDYNVNYFNPLQAKQVASHFEKLLDEILKYPGKEINKLEFLSASEKNKILVEFNNTGIDYSKENTVIDLFEEKSRIYFNKKIVQDDERSLTYRELNTLSDQLAQYLLNNWGVEDKTPVAVLLNRSADMPVVLLGILKSGRPYIPLDPAFPYERLKWILDQSQSKILITENEHFSTFENYGIKVLQLDQVLAEMPHSKKCNLCKVSITDSAYIIYTSGSTGHPKGVEISHGALANFLMAMKSEPGINFNDILFSVTTYSFDISILELFLPLISGAVLYIAGSKTLSEPRNILDKLKKIKPSVIQATPGFYQMLFNAGWICDSTLKILCGGDLLSENLAERLLNNFSEVWNMYGPTETTIWSGVKKLQHAKDACNIGRPIKNTRFYILDAHLALLPIGVIGNIYIAGKGLAKGYYLNEDLTQQKFKPNPFNPGERIYETGDMGKWNEKGEIEFCGRNDNQVKIRGYRIELVEIESQLMKIPGIKEAVVVARKEDNQDAAILAAYLITETFTVNAGEIKKILRSFLPAYMIPDVIIELEKLPTTLNQKIDRKALSQREIQISMPVVSLAKPKSGIEIKLLEFWHKILCLENEIGINDNFFALGGDSLSAVKLCSLIYKDIKFDISLKAVFDYPTVVLLSEYLESVAIPATQIPKAEEIELYDVIPQQYNLWLASLKEEISAAYNMSAAYSVKGILNIEKFEEAVRIIIFNNEILRTNFIEKGALLKQKIKSEEAFVFKIETEDLSAIKDIEEHVFNLLYHPFRLESDLLIRMNIIKENSHEYIVVFSAHHIIMDGMSLEIFIKELMFNYTALLNNEEVKREPLTVQFKDFSEWYNKKIKQQNSNHQHYWSEKLRGYGKKNIFHKDNTFSGNLFDSGRYILEFDEKQTSELKTLAIQNETTLFAVLTAGLNILLFKYLNYEDICLPAVISGRDHPGIMNSIGMFAKTIILRTKLNGKLSFFDILKQTKKNLIEDAYHDLPFDLLAGSPALFDTMIVYRNPGFNLEQITEIKEVSFCKYPVTRIKSRVPLVYCFYEDKNKIMCEIDFNSNNYELVSIQIAARKFMLLLDRILESPGRNLCDFDILLESEIRKENKIEIELNF